MSIVLEVLEVLDVSQSREVEPVADPARPGMYRTLATGDTVTRLVLKAPSGRAFVVTVPEEMFNDLYPPAPVILPG